MRANGKRGAAPRHLDGDPDAVNRPASDEGDAHAVGRGAPGDLAATVDVLAFDFQFEGVGNVAVLTTVRPAPPSEISASEHMIGGACRLMKAMAARLLPGVRGYLRWSTDMLAPLCRSREPSPCR